MTTITAIAPITIATATTDYYLHSTTTAIDY